MWLAFHDFERLFRGLDPGYHAVDTTYHDIQHTLDMTLALARLIAGHEMSVEPGDRLGPERAELALVSALFHDSGYLRHKELDAGAVNGAVFTRVHVTRSGRFLESYLPRIGLEQFTPVVSRIVHFTGYELNIDQIELEDPKDSIVGHLLGTADLVAQISDRCYLEKCRDRLYPEFVLGGVAIDERPEGGKVLYRSPHDLLVEDAVVLSELRAASPRAQLQPRVSLHGSVLRARPKPVHPVHPQEPHVLERRDQGRRLGAAAAPSAVRDARSGRRGASDGARVAARPELVRRARAADRSRLPQPLEASYLR